VRQVGYLQRLYRDARSTEHKKTRNVKRKGVIEEQMKVTQKFLERIKNNFPHIYYASKIDGLSEN